MVSTPDALPSQAGWTLLRPVAGMHGSVIEIPTPAITNGATNAP